MIENSCRSDCISLSSVRSRDIPVPVNMFSCWTDNPEKSIRNEERFGRGIVAVICKLTRALRLGIFSDSHSLNNYMQSYYNGYISWKINGLCFVRSLLLTSSQSNISSQVTGAPIFASTVVYLKLTRTDIRKTKFTCMLSQQWAIKSVDVCNIKNATKSFPLTRVSLTSRERLKKFKVSADLLLHR